MIDESPLCRALEEEILAMSKSRRIWHDRALAAGAVPADGSARRLADANRRLDELTARSNAQEAVLKTANDALLDERRKKDAASASPRSKTDGRATSSRRGSKGPARPGLGKVT